jgi:hypothetical protein
VSVRSAREVTCHFMEDAMTLSDFVASRRWTDDIATEVGMEGIIPNWPGYVYECDGLAWIALTDADGEYTAELFGGGQCHGTLAECEEAVFSSMLAFREDVDAVDEPSHAQHLTFSERRFFASQAVRWAS